MNEDSDLLDPAIDAALAQEHRAHAGRDPDRAQMLAAVRSYRAAWRELAEALDNCERRELWRKWSYASFQVYCTEELKLSKQLVTRYRNALAFLREQGPAAGLAVSLQSVEVAQKAAAAGESGEIPEAKAADLIARALAGEEGPRELGAELAGERPGRFKLVLFPDNDQRPDPVFLEKARKALARFEAVALPLRERMPPEVLEALDLVASYLEDPGDLDGIQDNIPAGASAAELIKNGDTASVVANAVAVAIEAVPTLRAIGIFEPRDSSVPVRYTVAKDLPADSEPVCSPDSDESEGDAAGSHVELPADLETRLEPKLLARGFEGKTADATLVLRYVVKQPRQLGHMAEDHRAAAVELVQLGLLTERAASVRVSQDCRELLAQLYDPESGDSW